MSFRWPMLYFLTVAVTAPAQGPNDRVILETSTIIDGKGGILKNRRIVVNGSKIESVGAASGPVSYDLRGLTVMPGWIDTHVHIDWHFDETGHITDRTKESPETLVLYSAENAWMTLLGGFTTIQSVGAPTDAPLRDRINKGRLPGPRVLTSINIIDPHTGSPEAIRALIRKLKIDGADLVKIFAATADAEHVMMSEEQLEAAVSEARAQGLRIIAHATRLPEEKLAVHAGVTSLEHGYGLDDETLDFMAQHGIYFDPNFLNSYNYIEYREAYRRPVRDVAVREQQLVSLKETVQRARKHNVKIVFGSDAVAGAHGRNAEEFIYRVHDANERPMDVVVSATSLSAESLGLGDQIGTVAPGMEADLVATDGNPLEDITAVRRVVFVMKAGRVYKNVARSVGR
jgi:imidazolonepropionase-like amidohydrolase